MRDRILVVSAGALWKVRCEDCSGESQPMTQIDAIKVARQHVAELPAGRLSQILIQRDNGQFRTEWTYGKDPYPPKG